MGETNTRRNARRTWIGVLLFLPLAAVILGTLACLPAPVGDPEKAAIDKDLIGAWEPAKEAASTATGLILVRPLDAHTYYIQYMIRDEKKEGDAVKEELTLLNYRGWLTTIGGETFICLEALDNTDYLAGDPADKPAEKPAAPAAPPASAAPAAPSAPSAGTQSSKPVVINFGGQKPTIPASEDSVYYWVAKLTKEKDKLTARPINADSALVKDLTTRAELEAAIAKNLKNDALYGDSQTFRKLGKEDLESIAAWRKKFHLGLGGN